MKKHVNIPIFIPHLGCPNQCVFCNQHSISGVMKFDPDLVDAEIRTALETISDETDVEIAFFGGSFTGIDRDLMIKLLTIAKSYLDTGAVKSVRCSTRPDYINSEILDILKKFGVLNIELGLQSVSDRVLSLSKRGHTFEDEKKAVKLITDQGFNLVGQMMIGLPGADINDEINTAKFIIDSGAKGARIYPTIVFQDTELCEMCKQDKYHVLSVEEAVERSAAVYHMFLKNGIDVIRVGLCSSENLNSDKCYYDGPNHPAIGELVINKIFLDSVLNKLEGAQHSADKIIKISVSRGALSKAVGHRKKNKLFLKKLLKVKDVIFLENDDLSGFEVSIEEDLGDL